MGPLLSYDDVAERLSCHSGTVRRMVRDGKIPKPRYYECVGLRFLASDIDLYIAGQWAANKPPPRRQGKKSADEK